MCAYEKTECKISNCTSTVIIFLLRKPSSSPYKVKPGLQYWKRHIALSPRTLARHAHSPQWQCGTPHQSVLRDLHRIEVGNQHIPVAQIFTKRKGRLQLYISRHSLCVRKMHEVSLAAPQVPQIIPSVHPPTTQRNPASPCNGRQRYMTCELSTAINGDWVHQTTATCRS